MIIVTGANGFIGSAFVWELNQAGITDIICVDTVNLSNRNLLQKRTYSQFFEAQELWSFLATPEAKKSVTWIVHMGACSSTTETNWDYLFANNFQYSQRLFEWCSQNQKSLIYASSAATYGAGENGFNDSLDSEKLKPLNLYGESKVIMDRWVAKQKATPPNWYGLKFFNVFGPNEYEKGSMASVAFKAYHQILKTNELGLFKSYNANYKDGEQLRDFVYVKDITRWIRELIQKKPQSGIYNMGFGEARSWLDMARALFAAMGKPLQINWLEMPDSIRNQYQYFTKADMTKWSSQNLSAPEWSLEKAITDYVQNHLSQKDPWL
ncbi:MAG: ADP-glyceromanno-heptose 6-epimerase [Bdellovibrionales bacterium RIFCSPHIGHO2_01_FULL_40_29]|nr:MAG: ADP-glyceromanno-heptose 6-epimerase [Bdellovibrionales bacterium RIFCSPHIGHO2_01_FULL_40_29]OFZ35183.1 MAG: ADP-glyceromanno-heptose 6-epimerase [Bdellovibrionales bacterium RIFCSPHIGHO2_02_FULL_40_15]